MSLQQKHLTEVIPIDAHDLIELAQNKIIQTGELRQEPDGYTFLKVSDEFIFQLFDMIHSTAKKMPDYFSGENPIGAHITIIYQNEFDKPIQIKEVGSQFNFKVVKMMSVVILKTKYFALEIESSSLAALRIKYGMPGNSLNFKGFIVPFHVTIAIELNR